jgi:hypothetical protein
MINFTIIHRESKKIITVSIKKFYNGKDKELKYPKGREGLESAKRILMKGSGIRFADSDDLRFPLIKLNDFYTVYHFKSFSICGYNFWKARRRINT